MKVLIYNGSPRQGGNTKTAVTKIAEGFANWPGAQVEVVDVAKKNLKGCINCDGCFKNDGNCVLPDDGADLMRQMEEAEGLIFASPVYWWGVSAQLKALIDKMYSKDARFHQQKKRVGVVAAGHHETTDRQYGLIRDQFACICDYLGWDLVFSESLSTPSKTSLAENPQKLDELAQLWRKFA